MKLTLMCNQKLVLVAANLDYKEANACTIFPKVLLRRKKISKPATQPKCSPEIVDLPYRVQADK
jgi:hypothetical protein